MSEPTVTGIPMNGLCTADPSLFISFLALVDAFEMDCYKIGNACIYFIFIEKQKKNGLHLSKIKCRFAFYIYKYVYPTKAFAVKLRNINMHIYFVRGRSDDYNNASFYFYQP